MNMKKNTKKDYLIIGVVSFINADLLLLLVTLFTSSLGFGIHYDDFVDSFSNVSDYFEYLLFSSIISIPVFFFLKWIYKNTVTGFWIVSVLICGTLIAFLSTYSHIFERLLF